RVSIGRIGLALGSSRDEVRDIRYGPVEAVGQGVRQTGEILSTTLTYIRRIFSGRESADQFSGPLGIAKAAGALTHAGVATDPAPWAVVANLVLPLPTFGAILSVAIAFLNPMPMPVPDGAHLLFYAEEVVERRPV